MADSPFDSTTLEALRELDAAEAGFLSGVLEDYAQQLQSLLPAIRAASEDSDWSKVKSLGHTLKGASGSVGAFAMRDLARDIESQSSDITQLQALLSQADEEATRVLAGIRVELAR